MKNKKEEKSAFVLLAIASILIAAMPLASAVWDSSDINFEVQLSETTCNDNGDRWLYPDGSSSNSLNNCKINVDSTTKVCCPLGYNCEQSGGRWNCVANATFTCFDYKTQSACSGYAESAAENSVYRTTGKRCGDYELVGNECVKQIINCKCEWNTNASKCDSKYSLNKNCSDGTGGILGECAFSDGGSTGCQEDIMLLKWNAVWTGDTADKPAECTDGNKQVPCRTTIKLPFFTITNAISVILILAVIYLIIYAIRKNQKIATKNKSRKNINRNKN